MKKLLLLTLALNAQLAAEPEKCQNCTQKQDQTAQVVISNFANMVMNVIQMAANPHDPQTLATGGCQIVGSIANIAQEACRMVAAGEATADEISAVFYAKMIESGVHEEIATQVSKSMLRTMSVGTEEEMK